MSASPLVDPSIMPTMVSRLPQLSSRSQTAPAAGRTRLTNGFYHHPGPAGGAMPSSSAKQNGFIRVPGSFLTKWRKEHAADCDEAESKKGKGGSAFQLCVQQGALLSQQDVNKQISPSAAKGRRQLTSSSSSPSPQSSPTALPVPKNRSQGSKPNPTSSVLSNMSKQSLKKSPGSKSETKISGSLRQAPTFPRPPTGSGSQSSSPLLKKAAASRSQSSDNIGGPAAMRLTDRDRLRSQSLNQVRQQASPTFTSKAAQHGSPASSSSSYALHRGKALKSPVSRAAPGRLGVAPTSQLPQSALKAPLFPNPTARPIGISYKLSRPSLIKKTCPLRATGAIVHSGEKDVHSVESPSSTEHKPENSPEAPELEQLSNEILPQEVGSVVGEMLEDMSLSSTSSLDRNDINQEYMDDFDNLGNGGAGVLQFSSKNEEDDSGLDQSCTRLDEDQSAMSSVTKTTGLYFLDDSPDWTSIRGDKGEERLERLARQRKPSQSDYHEQGSSSLDLSPSDSCGSGGTYMWDEEGLEPLGGSATTASLHTNTTQHVGSFDSDIDSVDLLNNLDSCDLADDDLMLDADFPEDSSLHSDGDGLSSMAQWRRRQLCWGAPDYESESDVQSYKHCQYPDTKEEKIRSACCSPAAHTLGLDVETLAEDCSAVRSQLEFLQSFLLQDNHLDDDTLTTDTLSPDTTDSSPVSNLQELLLEVQLLREELRSRDRTIAQLTMQLVS
ncbi:serine-rich coiled-coil domain-containing protein 2-like isoform X2 [Cyprinodon tularosa]|uniref:serine-rich coiled-coil domain-containing protein 2-like isoform X2 n=1 Tax=Cyprinodon tularosa TaxID=77115 RepID=UPI0018E23715|nr:serine-rich coiled-coil domain-containing protein 2-like isoform X2 [Cyprinodon tularosa]